MSLSLYTQKISELASTERKLAVAQKKLHTLEHAPASLQIVTNVVDTKTQQLIRNLEFEVNSARRNEYAMCVKYTSLNGGARTKPENSDNDNNNDNNDDNNEDKYEEVDVVIPAEYIDVEETHEIDVEISVPLSSSSSSSSSDTPELAAQRATLTTSLTHTQSSLTHLTTQISAIETPLKIQVSEYKTRLASFKESDAPRVALQDKLHVSKIRESDGSERELKMSDIDAFSSLLTQDKEIVEQRTLLQSRVNKLKEEKNALQAMKEQLQTMKDTLTKLKESGESDATIITQHESEYEEKKSVATRAAQEIKANYAEHEKNLAAFKEREVAYSTACAAYNFNSDVVDGKNRKLSGEEKSDLSSLIHMWKVKSDERDKLKQSADEVNARSTQLKALKIEKTKIEEEQAKINAEIASLPVSVSESESGDSEVKMEKKMVKQSVKKIVKQLKPGNVHSHTHAHTHTYTQCSSITHTCIYVMMLSV